LKDEENPLEDAADIIWRNSKEGRQTGHSGILSPGLLTDAANDNATTVRSFEEEFISPFARAPPASVTELCPNNSKIRLLTNGIRLSGKLDRLLVVRAWLRQKSGRPNGQTYIFGKIFC
jgi:hypothetical protein